MTQTMQFMACGSQMVRPVLFLAIFFNDSSLLLLFSGLGILSLKCISDVLLLKRFFPIFPKCNGTFCKIFYHFGMWIVEEQLKKWSGICWRISYHHFHHWLLVWFPRKLKLWMDYFLSLSLLKIHRSWHRVQTRPATTHHVFFFFFKKSDWNLRLHCISYTNLYKMIHPTHICQKSLLG